MGGRSGIELAADLLNTEIGHNAPQIPHLNVNEINGVPIPTHATATTLLTPAITSS
jgi:hypothetical protein